MRLRNEAIKIAREDGLRELGVSTAEKIEEIPEDLKNKLIWPMYNKYLFKLTYPETQPDPYKLIYIDPSNVSHLLTPHFWKKLSRYTTHIVRGGWDINHSECSVFLSGWHEFEHSAQPRLVSFENYVLYDSFLKHFSEHVPWEDTELYKHLQKNSEQYWHKYNTEEEFKTTLQEVDDLYNSIKSQGYRKQTSLRESESEYPLYKENLPPNLDEVSVNIGRNGNFIFDDGRHRFCIAKILNVPEIPVRVHVRHKKWQSIRQEFSKCKSYEELSPSASKYVGHPDLVGL